MQDGSIGAAGEGRKERACREEDSMTINRFTALAAASAAALALACPAAAAELVYGSWTPAQEYQNRVAMPELFRNIEKDTNGAIKWKLIAGGQIADGKTT